MLWLKSLTLEQQHASTWRPLPNGGRQSELLGIVHQKLLTVKTCSRVMCGLLAAWQSSLFQVIQQRVFRSNVILIQENHHSMILMTSHAYLEWRRVYLLLCQTKKFLHHVQTFYPVVWFLSGNKYALHSTASTTTFINLFLKETDNWKAFTTWIYSFLNFPRKHNPGRFNRNNSGDERSQEQAHSKKASQGNSANSHSILVSGHSPNFSRGKKTSLYSVNNVHWRIETKDWPARINKSILAICALGNFGLFWIGLKTNSNDLLVGIIHFVGKCERNVITG